MHISRHIAISNQPLPALLRPSIEGDLDLTLVRPLSADHVMIAMVVPVFESHPCDVFDDLTRIFAPVCVAPIVNPLIEYVAHKVGFGRLPVVPVTSLAEFTRSVYRVEALKPLALHVRVIDRSKRSALIPTVISGHVQHIGISTFHHDTQRGFDVAKLRRRLIEDFLQERVLLQQGLVFL